MTAKILKTKTVLSRLRQLYQVQDQDFENMVSRHHDLETKT